ncbi:MAG TPA: hypothetical protein VFG71_00085 [Nitrospiraceae bacterium]|nr:hypothetical protein [Nitrospiraceae bacterium]
MKGKERILFRAIVAAVLIVCGVVWSPRAAETAFIAERVSDVARVIGPVHQMTVTTKNSVATLYFSAAGVLLQQVIRNRAAESDDPGETTEYRYDEEGRTLGEYVADPDGEVVPLRLYAYNDKHQLSAEAAYHMCRTFSSLHVYRSDEENRIIEDMQFESRRLTKREFQYADNSKIARVTMHRNGRPMSITHYTYADAGHVATAVSEQPDGSMVRRLYRHNERGHVIILVETHPRDSARDKTEITTYEYDEPGNWTRRTIIRAVNPLDEEGLPFEEPVEVVEREIVYADSSAQ